MLWRAFTDPPYRFLHLEDFCHVQLCVLLTFFRIHTFRRALANYCQYPSAEESNEEQHKENYWNRIHNAGLHIWVKRTIPQWACSYLRISDAGTRPQKKGHSPVFSLTPSKLFQTAKDNNPFEWIVKTQ